MEQHISVLLIEDDPDYALLLSLYFNEACGDELKHALEPAASLAAGLDLLARKEFDVVLLDLLLPDSQGLESLSRIRRAAPGVPIVVLTNLERAEIGLKAIGEGAQDFLLKSKVDAQQLRRTIRFALERGRQFAQIEALVSNSPDGVVIVDKAGVVRYANRAALSLFNRTAKQLQGRPFEHPLSAEKPSELKLRGPEGERDVELRATPVEWKGAEARLVTIRDITSLKRLEQVRAEVKERRRMDELKDKLLSTVSHELRTPLSVITIIVGTLLKRQSGPLSKDQENLLRTADRNVARLTRILNNFLDLSRLESGNASVDRQAFDSGALLREIADDLRLVYKSKNVALSLAVATGLPEVTADRDMIAQAVGNLLGNALRYARAHVQVRAERIGNEVVVSVIDDGHGIPEGKADGLFDKFVQLERPKGGDGYKGTGLGLAICREIMGLNGGRIWAENVAGWGAGFHLVLPLSAPVPASSAAGGHRE